MADHSIAADIETLIAEFARSGVRELHLRAGDFELFLSNDPAASAGMTPPPPTGGTPRMNAVPAPLASSPAVVPPSPSVAAVASESDLPAGAVIVRAPNLGTFYRSPKPGAAFYVEIGASVAPGDELCLIEVMKLFTAVRAEIGGRVHAVLAPDGEMVEAGQPLFAIVRD